jgi:Beta-galactosidase
MPVPTPHPKHRPVRILFVFAWLVGGNEDTEVRLLAGSLEPARYRIDVIPCFPAEGMTDEGFCRLEEIGVKVDRTALHLSFEDTVRYLERKLAGYEIVVSCQNVADIYPALERLRHRPPLIEHGTTVCEALAGPKHFTTRYVGVSQSVRDAAASRMPDRPQDARVIPPMRDPAVAGQWTALFEEVLATTPASPPSLFRSFVQGGFECSTHRLQSGRRLDIIAATGHDIHAEADYRQLGQFGLRTFRDGLRWHLIEPSPGRYDFASFRQMLTAAQATGAQVIWDLMHYGWPDDLDIWSPAFVDRFARFARAAARVFADHTDDVPFWCPVNEISFHAWAGGDARYMAPFEAGRGFELKVQLARASIAAMLALRDVDPRARFVHCEPVIAVHHDPATGRPAWEAEGWHQAQFQALELIMGRHWPQIGGDPSFLDIIGLNYYANNQWIHGGPTIDVDHPLYRPFGDLLFETYARYARPILVAETGTEGPRRASWFRYVADEVARTRQRGVPVEGICLYPILNHHGWDNDRLCPNGLLSHDHVNGARCVEPDLKSAVIDVAASYAAPPPPHSRRNPKPQTDVVPLKPQPISADQTKDLTP